jgi:hypothetical protein
MAAEHRCDAITVVAQNGEQRLLPVVAVAISGFHGRQAKRIDMRDDAAHRGREATP